MSYEAYRTIHDASGNALETDEYVATYFADTDAEAKKTFQSDVNDELVNSKERDPELQGCRYSIALRNDNTGVLVDSITGNF